MIISDISTAELLRFATENNIIDITYVQEQVEMKRKKEYLDKHPYKIWQGKDNKWYTYLPDEKKGRVQRERKTQAEIENLIVKYWEKQSENPTIKEVFDEWNNRRLKLNKIASSTHERNQQIFKRHYKEFGNKRIKSISADEVEEFLEEQIAEHNLSAKAFANLKSITKNFLIRAKKRKLINFNIEEMFYEMDVSDTSFKKVVKEDYQEVFNEDEMDTMMEYLVNNLDAKNIGILLMFLTGIRVGELVALKHSDFDGNIFKIRRTETRVRAEKGYSYEIKEFPKSEAGLRTAVIPNSYSWICAKIKALNPFGEYIFTDDEGERMTTNCIRRRQERNCKRLGIYKKSPHKIRKTYGSILLDNKVDQRLVVDIMGHADIACTEGYYHRNRKSQNQKLQIISNIPEFQAK